MCEWKHELCAYMKYKNVKCTDTANTASCTEGETQAIAAGIVRV